MPGCDFPPLTEVCMLCVATCAVCAVCCMKPAPLLIHTDLLIDVSIVHTSTKMAAC